MLRSSIAILIAAVAIGLPGGAPDSSFREGMVPVRIADGVGHTILVSRYEVTMKSWQQCYRRHGCSYMPKSVADPAHMPATGVNWFDVNEYLAWANERAGGGLRLPTGEEWRYLNRGHEEPQPDPLFTDPRLEWAANYGRERTPTGPVRTGGAYGMSGDGVADLDGNVWEWTSSCYKPGFSEGRNADCPAFLAMGAHEAVVSVFIRNPASGGCATGTPPTHLGFRLVMDK